MKKEPVLVLTGVVAFLTAVLGALQNIPGLSDLPGAKDVAAYGALALPVLTALLGAITRAHTVAADTAVAVDTGLGPVAGPASSAPNGTPVDVIPGPVGSAVTNVPAVTGVTGATGSTDATSGPSPVADDAEGGALVPGGAFPEIPADLVEHATQPPETVQTSQPAQPSQGA